MPNFPFSFPFTTHHSLLWQTCSRDRGASPALTRTQTRLAALLPSVSRYSRCGNNTFHQSRKIECIRTWLHKWRRCICLPRNPSPFTNSLLNSLSIHLIPFYDFKSIYYKKKRAALLFRRNGPHFHTSYTQFTHDLCTSCG
jgi:hypothetical protein